MRMLGAARLSRPNSSTKVESTDVPQQSVNWGRTLSPFSRRMGTTLLVERNGPAYLSTMPGCHRDPGLLRCLCADVAATNGFVVDVPGGEAGDAVAADRA